MFVGDQRICADQDVILIGCVLRFDHGRTEARHRGDGADQGDDAEDLGADGQSCAQRVSEESERGERDEHKNEADRIQRHGPRPISGVSHDASPSRGDTFTVALHVM